MRSIRRRSTGWVVMVVAIAVGGATPEDASWLVKAGGGSAMVRTPGGSWSRWEVGTRRDLPVEIKTTPHAAPLNLWTRAGATVWPLRDTHFVFHGRTIRLLRGGVVVRTGRCALEVAAATASVVIPDGRVRLRLDAGGGVLLLVEAGSIIHAGRSHRAGSALRWRVGYPPSLRPWPRGRPVAPTLPGQSPSATDDAPAPDTIATITFAERSFRRVLLRICGEEPRRNRWLALALLIETGTPVERAAAAGLATGTEAEHLLHVLREATHDADERVCRAARTALARRQENAPDRPRGDFLADPRVCRLVRDVEARRARFEASVVNGGASVLSILPRWRTHGALDVLTRVLRTVPDRDLSSIVLVLERVLGRRVDPEARVRLGDRQAASLLLLTVGRTFQPPGEDLLFP